MSRRYRTPPGGALRELGRYTGDRGEEDRYGVRRNSVRGVSFSSDEVSVVNAVSAFAATLWIAFGGALGSIARYWTAVAVARLTGESFPWGTLLINIVGSFVIAYFGASTLPTGVRPASIEMRLFVMVGICGGFTTFSSFSMQTIDLLRGGEAARAVVYIVGSVAICLAGTMFGLYLASPGELASVAARS
jgi:fluoride exporter